MGELRFSGLSSGIDTTALVKQLMTIESRRLATFRVGKMNLEKQTTALNDLRTKINALKSAAAGLSDLNSMQIYTAASSNKDILSVTASSTAAAGAHSVAVNQLASTETWIQNTSTFSYKTDYVGGGNFIYTYNNQQRVITAVENETTLQDLVNLINTDEKNPGVTASLLFQSGKYHMMLSGQDAGQDYQISIDASSREIWKPAAGVNSTFTKDQQNAGLTTKITELDQFSGTLGAADKITLSGKNHAGSVLPDLELTITQNTTVGHLIDTLNQQFSGTATARLVNGQIVLTDTTAGPGGMEIRLSFSGQASLGLPTMAVSTEGGATVESLASLNSASFVETKNAQNAKVRVDGFPTGTINEVQTLSFTGGVPTSGTFKLTFQGQTTAALAYNASAADIQSALEALTGIGPGDVMVTGSELPSGTLTIEFAGNLAGTDIPRMTVSDDGSLNTGVVSIVETIKGNDGWLHRNSNTITDAIEGVSLGLNDVTPENNPVKVTVNRNTSSISKKIQTLVAAYNDLVSELKTKTEYNTETKQLGLLNRNVAATSLKTQNKTPFTTIAKGFLESVDHFVQAGDIGLTLDGAGKLKFDTEKFDNALNENYKGVLDLLGAAKSGSSSSTDVHFYNASTKYTTAGIYHVKIVIDENNQITSAKIKLSTETEYRDADSWDDNIVSFNSSFNGKGNPANPEHSLQLSVDLAQGTYGTDQNPIIVRVKQGIFGSLEETLNTLLKTDGQMDISNEAIDTKVSQMKSKIEKEEARLKKVEARLTQKYARLEKILTSMQQQMASVGSMFTTTFGN
jgi:flagellar hook-associated protein 2